MLCLAYKIISVEYFMDSMQEYEIYDIYNGIQYSNMYSWEQTRWIAYAICQVNSKKKLKLTDIMKLPIDKDFKPEKHDIEISDNDISRLKEKSKEISKYLQ